MLIGFLIMAVIWIALLYLTKKAGLQAWYILTGMIGFFLIGMIFIRPVITMPLAELVTALAGIFGKITGFFTPYFKYAVLFISTKNGTMTLQIDFECSGVIEILVYLAIILFFRVCTVSERTLMAVMGTLYLIVFNALRIILICTIVHFGGNNWYYVAHTFIGRIFFYAATVWLYYHAVTRPQIARMQVGSFSYDDAGKKEK